MNYTSTLLIITLLSLPLTAQTGGNLHATAQCESVNTNVLGITSLKDCDIGLTNYGATQLLVSQAMLREFFPTLDIENSARAQAVGDKAFNNSKKSRAIAILNFLSPLTVAFMGGGLIHASVEAIAAVSLANTAGQSFKNYLIGQQPDEASFLPTCPDPISLTPYGTPGFSQVCTVLGSIDYTNSPVVTPAVSGRFGAALPAKRGSLVWNGNLPPIPPAPQTSIDHPGVGPKSEGAIGYEHPQMPTLSADKQGRGESPWPPKVQHETTSPSLAQPNVIVTGWDTKPKPVVTWEAGLNYVAFAR